MQASSEHALGVIQRHPVASARPAIVSGHQEALEAELLHHLDLVLGHAAERVVAVVGESARLAAVTVAAQVRRDDRELGRQPRRDEAPVDVRQWIAVQQEQRRPAAAHHAMNRHPRIAGGQIEAPKALVHLS